MALGLTDHIWSIEELIAEAPAVSDDAERSALTHRSALGLDPGACFNRQIVPIRLTLVTRRDCHLCEEMAAVIGRVAPLFGADVETRNVDADPDLRARHGEEVPVLLIDGRKAFKYRLSVADLTRRLRAERRRAVLRQWRARLTAWRST